MLSSSQRRALLTTALLSSLMMTACGSKQDASVGGVGAPTATTTTAQTNGQAENNLISPSGGSTSVNQVKESSQNGVGTYPIEYNPNDPTNINRDGVAKRLTGAVTADGFVYTSTSTDSLLNFLRARNERVDQNTRTANLQAAASILSAKMSVDSFSGDAVVTVKVQEYDGVKTYNVAGAMAGGLEDRSATLLKSVVSGNGVLTTGYQSIEGTLKCLDLDGGCENVFVRLRLGTPGSSAIVNIVFRNSVSDLYFSLPGQHSDNPEYLIMREYIINTVKQANIEGKIKQARMSSFEVINGRSGVALTILGYNNELLGFSGALLAPEAGSGVNLPAARLASTMNDSSDLLTVNQEKLTYANWIGDSRIVANNGLGQVKLALKMRKRSTFAQDTFTVTFMRRIKPLVELTDDNLK